MYVCVSVPKKVILVDELVVIGVQLPEFAIQHIEMLIAEIAGHLHTYIQIKAR